MLRRLSLLSFHAVWRRKNVGGIGRKEKERGGTEGRREGRKEREEGRKERVKGRKG
jgi:hypothetical protein